MQLKNQMTDKLSNISKVLVVYKKSVYQKYVLDENNESITKRIKENHVSTKKLYETHRKNLSSINKVEKKLEKHGIKYRITARSSLKSINNYDLVITIGGDGTFLRTAQHIKDAVLIGVNSHPKVSVGALCSIPIDDFDKKFDAILAGKYKLKEITRIQMKINGDVFHREAVNDILFTNTSPAATSRYVIVYKGTKEEHKSSGIWISTASGSTAAIMAAGGKKMPTTDKRLQFITREPYQGIFHPYKLINDYIQPGKTMKIMNKMVKARLYVDGPTTFHTMNYGDEVEFSLSKNHLKVIV